MRCARGHQPSLIISMRDELGQPARRFEVHELTTFASSSSLVKLHGEVGSDMQALGGQPREEQVSGTLDGSGGGTRL